MAALRLARMTQTEWAEKQGVTQGHLSQVLHGRESKSLEAKIDAFADATLKAANAA